MPFPKRSIPDQDPANPDAYVGNIWGWKFSFLSLALILLMLVWMAIRYARLEPDTQGAQDPVEASDPPSSSQ